MLSPDLALLERLLNVPCYATADAAEAAEMQFHHRTSVLTAATGYVRALAELQRALDAFPAPAALPPAVAQFLREVQR